MNNSGQIPAVPWDPEDAARQRQEHQERAARRRRTKWIAAIGLATFSALLICLLSFAPAAGSWVGLFGLLPIYFSPTIIAGLKHHRNTGAIGILNLLAGWTVIGWIAAVVWAVYEEKKHPGK